MSDTASNREDTGSTATPSFSPYEERRWSTLASKMQYFHSYMKQEYEEIYELADGEFSNRGMSLSEFLLTAHQFRIHLTTHHTVEENYLFPALAEKMATFRDDECHRNSHKGIHDGLDTLATLLVRYRGAPSTYSPAELRACLDSFREVLMNHLDEEVQDLQGENLRKYWTLDEFDRMLSRFGI